MVKPAVNQQQVVIDASTAVPEVTRPPAVADFRPPSAMMPSPRLRRMVWKNEREFPPPITLTVVNASEAIQRGVSFYADAVIVVFSRIHDRGRPEGLLNVLYRHV